jgi:hypothetical protein
MNNSSNVASKPIPCFRGGAAPPPLETLEEKLKRPFRIRCRPTHIVKAVQNPEHPKRGILFSNEKKIERQLRSKSGWDAMFEVAPMNPWRETSTLHKTPEEPGTILHLDFKNFYPSLICKTWFPHPAKLLLVKKPVIDFEAFGQQGPCGLFRTILHPCSRTPERLRHHHPFQIQHTHKSLPFLIEDRPIETFLHGPELAIWQHWFDLEITEALVSHPIRHPLAKQTYEALIGLQNENPDPKEREEKKLLINLAATTPKIGSPLSLPSPHGVHCLPSQIVGLARALLCQTIHIILENNPGDRLLSANTDGMLICSQNPEQTLRSIQPILGESPGQLREKGRGDEAIIVGPNLWWLLADGKLVETCGQGQETHPVPLHYHFGKHLEQKLATIHLADFRHHLNHQTLERKKFQACPAEEIPQIIQAEKKRSLIPTLRKMRDLRKRVSASCLPTNNETPDKSGAP